MKIIAENKKEKSVKIKTEHSQDLWYIAKIIKEHDDINVLCLASDFTEKNIAWDTVKTFLKTKFKNEEKYLRRIKKVEDYENKNYSIDQC